MTIQYELNKEFNSLFKNIALDKLYQKMAESYVKYIVPILPAYIKDKNDKGDIIFTEGLKEGLNKYLSNAYIGSFIYQYKKETKNHIRKAERRLTTHFFTEDAYSKIEDKIKNNNLKNQDLKGLVFEHAIPKNIYQDKIMDKMKDIENNELRINYIKNLLKEYWIIVTVTEAENKLLSEKNRKIKKLYDIESYKNNKFIRYKNAKLYDSLKINKHLGKEIVIRPDIKI